MIHMLGLVGPDDALNRVPAFGISFPFGHYSTEIEVVVNKVWLENMQGPFVDSPDDEEEDFDEKRARDFHHRVRSPAFFPARARRAGG